MSLCVAQIVEHIMIEISTPQKYFKRWIKLVDLISKIF